MKSNAKINEKTTKSMFLINFDDSRWTGRCTFPMTNCKQEEILTHYPLLYMKNINGLT